MTTTNPVTVDHIETTVFRLPMKGSLQWGKNSRLAELRHVLIRVFLSNGADLKRVFGNPVGVPEVDHLAQVVRLVDVRYGPRPVEAEDAED